MWFHGSQSFNRVFICSSAEKHSVEIVQRRHIFLFGWKWGDEQREEIHGQSTLARFGPEFYTGFGWTCGGIAKFRIMNGMFNYHQIINHTVIVDQVGI